MKVQLDFTNKVVRVDKRVNVVELMDFIKTLPEWEEWYVDTHTVTNWYNPITLPVDNTNPFNTDPYWYTSSGDTSSTLTTNGKDENR